MRKEGVLQAEIELVVPFFDVDMMEVVWHGHYVKYFEEARCVLLDKLGHNYRQMRDAGYAWPIIDLQVRFRTVGDISCTAPVESDADSVEKIVVETATTTITERGATRLDDQTSDASMEQRKKEGYF